MPTFFEKQHSTPSRSFVTLGLAVALIGIGVLAACDGTTDSLGNRTRPGGENNSSSGNPGSSSGSSSGDPADTRSEEEKLFRALEADFLKMCGQTCHADGTYKPTPPTFLAPPDAYKSVKSHPGMVTKDVYQSAILNKKGHAGPDIATNKELEEKVIKWLEAESLALQSVKLPTSEPFAVVQGANDMDLSTACTGGLTGVHLKFTAGLVGGMLSLTDLKIVAPAGKDVHIMKPRFVRILATPKEDGTTEVADPADSFSNSEQTVPNGKETTLAPGSALFTSDSWRPWTFGSDKLRVEVEKLEPGTISEVGGAKACKDPAKFGTDILPSFRGQGVANINCNNCHANGLANLSLGGNDNQLICDQVLAKMNTGKIADSVIITKVTVGPHNGGTVNNANAWSQLFTNNQAIFF